MWWCQHIPDIAQGKEGQRVPDEPVADDHGQEHPLDPGVVPHIKLVHGVVRAARDLACLVACACVCCATLVVCGCVAGVLLMYQHSREDMAH